MSVFLADHDRSEQVYGGQPLLVMVVDEQDAFRRKIRDILHGMGGFQVVAEATSFHDVLEALERLSIDLVIADLAPGDMSSIALITQLKGLATSPHVVVFSSTMHDATVMQAVLAGADGYLMKDTPTRDIIRALKHFERGGPAMLPAVATNVIHLLVERCRLAAAGPPSGQQPFADVNGALIGMNGTGEGRTSLLPGADLPPRLSPQEEKVFLFLRQGLSNKQIAGHMAISPYTVGKHVQNILRKLKVVNRTQAVAYTSFEGYDTGLVVK